ncbi:MAG TPA: exodeoxyribonuclease VII large subunit [Acidimicrobiales bacterium]|nr:exodeoxyribonuclease VII large subunit [Acidimicrobiales bacterium]
MSRAEQPSFFPEEVPDPTYGVGELAAAVTRAVAAAFPSEVWVRGEIDGLRPANASGHVYFSLCERNSRRGPTASLGVALFRTDRLRVERELRAWPGFALADGLEVRIRGRVQHRFGRVQLVMSAVDPVHTLGRLAADRERVLATLAAEGLLEANARLPLDPVPLRVGLVTSAGSAACADVLAGLESSGFAFQVTLADARVQGTGAETSILRALHLVARQPLDVVVVARGGGARTDLVTFDSERLARAVAAMPVPVLTGVGHETDSSVVDEVAHTACKTPTACAGVLVERVAGALARAEAAWAATSRRGRTGLARAEARLGGHAGAVAVRAGGALAGARGRLDGRAAQTATLARSRMVAGGARLDAATRRLDASRLDARLAAAEARVTAAGTRVGRAASQVAATADATVDVAAARVGAADPARALARGWSLTRTAGGCLVRRAGQLQPGDDLVTTFADGEARSTVTARTTTTSGES